MEHNRKQKLLMIFALVFGIASLSVGFAAFSVSLNISSSASVTPNSDTFSVKFSTSPNSLVVAPIEPTVYYDGMTVNNGIIDNSSHPTVTNLSATFTELGQMVEYTFFVRNEGEYTAYLNNINFLGEKICKAEAGATDSLVQSACDSIKIGINIGNKLYEDTTLVSGHALAPGTGEKILIGIEYVYNGVYADGPFSITLPNIALVYSTIDDSSIKPKVIKLESGNLNMPGSIVSIGDERFYVFGQENGNVKLLSMYNLYVGNISYGPGTTVIPLENPTGIQDEEAKALIRNVSPWIGTTLFSSKNSTYVGSVVEGYVNNYATYLVGLGVNIEEARIITKEELETLGCISSEKKCTGAPDFVYKTSYWAEDTYSTVGLYVLSDASFDWRSVSDACVAGVRPVIEISLSEF